MKLDTLPKTPSRRDIVYEGIEFRDTTFIDVGLYDVVGYLKRRDFKEIAKIGEMDVFYIGMSDFLVAYPSKEQRDSERDKMIQMSGYTNTEELQMPEFRGEFEYDGRFFNAIGVRREFLGETTDILYKGIIINAIEFMKRQPAGVMKGVKDIAGDVIGEGKVQ